MKALTWKLVLPLSIIAFTAFTKWWYVLPVDAPDTMMLGFPLIWLSDGWHTSLSLQIFVTELILDLSVYFIFCFVLVFTIHRFIIKIELPKALTLFLWVTTSLIGLGAILIGSMPEHIFKVKKDFEYEVLTMGYKFIWQRQQRPELKKYRLQKMEKNYKIFIDQSEIGTTRLEKADAPMGVVFGTLFFNDPDFGYTEIKDYCSKNGIELSIDDPTDKIISTMTIANLKVIDENGVEIKGLGNKISGMDGETFEIEVFGIPYPFYEEAFPHHVKAYHDRFEKE